MQTNANKRTNKSLKIGGGKPDNLPPCEGFVPIPKFGKHPVMDLSEAIAKSTVSAKDHIPDQALEQTEQTTNSKFEENTMKAAQNEVVNNRNELSEGETNEQQTSQQTTEETFVTYGSNSAKPHWAVIAGAGALIGAAANYDKSLVVVGAAAVAAGAVAAGVGSYLDDNTLVGAAAAALAVGIGTRFLAPAVLNVVMPTSNENENELSAMETSVEDVAVQFV